MDRSEFASSDYVCVELDAEIFEMLQQNHGGWNATMAGVHTVHCSSSLACVH